MNRVDPFIKKEKYWISPMFRAQRSKLHPQGNGVLE